jgi:hypothetical protein
MQTYIVKSYNSRGEEINSVEVSNSVARVAIENAFDVAKDDLQKGPTARVAVFFKGDSEPVASFTPKILQNL